MTTIVNPKAAGILRRLAACEGYLELNMPTYALGELRDVAEKYTVQEISAFSPIVNLLHGRALMAVQRYEEAIRQLKCASSQLAPHNRMALDSLSQCYRLNGQSYFANQAAKMAEDSDGETESIFHVHVSHR